MRIKVNDYNRLRSRRLPAPGWLGLVESCITSWLDDACFGSKATRQNAMQDFEVAAESPCESPILAILSQGTGYSPEELLSLLKKIVQKKRNEIEVAKAAPTQRSRGTTKRHQPVVREGTLRWWRTYAGLSQARLAQLSGLSEDSIRNIESGQTRPKPGTAIQLCNALNLQPDDVKEFASLGLAQQTDIKKPEHNHKAA